LSFISANDADETGFKFGGSVYSTVDIVEEPSNGFNVICHGNGLTANGVSKHVASATVDAKLDIHKTPPPSKRLLLSCIILDNIAVMSINLISLHKSVFISVCNSNSVESKCKSHTACVVS